MGSDLSHVSLACFVDCNVFMCNVSIMFGIQQNKHGSKCALFAGNASWGSLHRISQDGLHRVSQDGSVFHRTSTDSPRESWRVSHDGIYPNMSGQPAVPQPAVPQSHGNWSRRSSAEMTPSPQASARKSASPVWPQSAQQNLVSQPEAGKAELTRQQEIANAAASSFFAPTAPRTLRRSQDLPAKNTATSNSGKPSPAIAVPAQHRQAQHAQHDKAKTPGGTASSAFFESGAKQQPAQQQHHMHHWTAGKPSLHPQQVQAQAAANLMRHQQASAVDAFQKQQAHFHLPQSHVHQLASLLQRLPPAGFSPANEFGQNSGQPPYLPSRVSCDYPQTVAKQRASADFAFGQHSASAQLHRTSSLDNALSRQSLAAAQQLAVLGEAANHRAAAAATAQSGKLPLDSLWLGHTQNTHPAAAWPMQHHVQQHALSPQALQLHALNTLNAMHRGPHQQSSSQHSQWVRMHQNSSALPDFGANALQFPPFRQSSRSSSQLDVHPPASLRSSMEAASLPFGGNQHPSQAPPVQGAAPASEVQGVWGSHLDASDSPSSRPSTSASRQKSKNPFLQPDSRFSIREAKQLLQHPRPLPNRAIPRVDTFASTLHDAWGAHAEHDTPPEHEAVLDQPPRLSSESVRSNVSHKSQASSSELCMCITPSHTLSLQLSLACCCNFSSAAIVWLAALLHTGLH